MSAECAALPGGAPEDSSNEVAPKDTPVRHDGGSGSNRFREGPLSLLSGTTPPFREGIDKLVLMVPILGVLLGWQHFKETTWRSAGSTAIRSWNATTLYLWDDCCIHISFGSLFKQGLMARVEFNPSRVLYPSDWWLAPFESLYDVLALVQEAVSSVIELAVPLMDASIAGVHYAFDIQTEDPSVHIRATGLRPHRKSYGIHVYTDAGTARSAVLGNTHFRLNQYDKYIESGGEAFYGTLRTEAAFKSRGIAPAGLSTVAALTLPLIRAAAMKRIIEAGLHLPVEVGGTRFLHAALKAEDWSDLRIRSFLGHLVNREQGIEDHLSRSTRRTYEQTMRRFGIALDLDPSLSHASAESSVRSLNFDTCAEEIAA